MNEHLLKDKEGVLASCSLFSSGITSAGEAGRGVGSSPTSGGSIMRERSSVGAVLVEVVGKTVYEDGE